MANSLKAKKTLVNEQARLRKYFPASLQREVASNSRNNEKQRDLLLSHVENAHPDLARIFNDNYYQEIDGFIESMEAKYPKERNDAIDKKMGLQPSKKVFVKTSSSKPTRRGTIEVTREGQTYKKQKPVDFENPTYMKRFIETRVKQGKTNKEVTSEYNSYAKSKGYVQRTPKSISNFKYLNRIKK